MTYVLSVPILALVIAAYLILGAGGGLMLDSDAYTATLASGAELTLRTGDFFTLAGLLALFVEMLKAARAGRGTILDHMLSTAVFVGALLSFLLIDVVAGFSISIFSTRRDFSIDR